MKRDAVKNLHGSKSVQDVLMKKGYYSSAEIIHRPKHVFMKDMEKVVNEEEAEQIHKKARINYMKMTHGALALSNMARSSRYKAARNSQNSVARMAEDTDLRQFEHIPSYREIFGTTDYCTCKKCKSIFGPAAYFVDLMRITDAYVELNNQAIPLKERRRDLWDLILSCKNTNEELPYVQIVNEIIEKYLDSETLYEDISQSCYPQLRPFSLPVAKTRLYIERKEVTPEYLLKCWQTDSEKTAAQALGISLALYQLLKMPLNAEGQKKLLGGEYSLEEMSVVSFFLERLQMNYEQMYRLLEQDIKETEADRDTLLHNLFINRCLSADTYVRIEDGMLLNLNGDALERIVRFVRLGRLMNLEFADLEWLLRITNTENGQIPMQQVCEIWQMSVNMGIPLQTLFVLFGDLKDYGDNPFYQVFQTDRAMLSQLSEEELLRKLSEVIPAKYEDVCILRDYMGSGQGTPDAFYRHMLLAQSLYMEISDYVTVLGLIYETPVLTFTPKLLEKLWAFKQAQIIPLETMIQVVMIHSQPEEALPKELSNLPEELRYIEESMPQEYKQDEEKRKNYIYMELSDYFQVDEAVMEDIFACTVGEKTDALPDSVLAEEGLIRGMYGYLLLYRSNIPIELLKTVSFYHGIFSIERTDCLDIYDVQAILRFLQYENTLGDQEGLLYDFAADYSAGKGNGALIKLTGWNAENVNALVDKWFPDGQEPDILTYLDRLGAGMYLLDKLALQPAECETIVWILSNGFTDYGQAEEKADKLVDAFLTEEEKAALEAEKRTAILPCAKEKLQGVFADIKDDNDLYKYFLVDVKMDDKTKISYVKEAINAVQLYLQRCRMHLEVGIKEIAIPSPWWTWMMDYTMWESNRRIFVYPENYLLPSVRHSKTGLFKEVEDALEQSNATEGYIEEQYMKYLDSYYDLTQLKICGAYETTIDYLNVLYVFARTKQEPYSYYLCSQTGNLAWTEWEKIDINIDSDSIYPVYVFGRLHIFWTVVQVNKKIKLKDGAELSADNQDSYTLQIKYTYKNLQGTWIAPQTLLGEETIYVEETGDQWKNADTLSRDFHVYDIPSSYRKLTLMKLTEKNLKDFKGDEKSYECLAVITGSFSFHQGRQLDKVQGDSVLDGSQKEYLDKLNKIVENNNFEFFNKGTGYLSTGVFKIYSEDMEEVKLLHDREFVVVDAYIPTRTSLVYREVYDELHKAVGVYLSQSILEDGAIPSKDILPFFNNSPEAKRPVLTKTSFVIDAGSDGEITSELSEKIFEKLVVEGIIRSEDNKTGYTNEKYLASADLQQYLGELLSDGADKNNQILKIQDILLKNIGAVYLFGKAEGSVVIPVINQPEKFICDCGDEAFLITPVYSHSNKGKQEILPVPIIKTEEGTLVGNVITAAEIARLGIRKQIAQQITDILQGADIISEETNIVSILNCTRDKLEEVLSGVELPGDRAKVLDRLYGCLMYLPVIAMNDFKDIPHISAQKICQVLKSPENRVLYPWNEQENTYRVDFLRMKEKTDIVFYNDSNGVLEDESVALIYDVLKKKASSIHFNYRVNKSLPYEFRKVAFKDWQFAVQRMTNPTIKKLRRKLETGGIDAFLNRQTQSPPENPVMPFDRFAPSLNVIPPKAKDGAQIDFDGLYGEYNWELFYHIPMMIAGKFRANSLYEEGLKWLNYVFNPTKQPDAALEKYYWNFYPFTKMESETMEQILGDAKAISAYNDSPFDPHAIARLREDAYGKYTVMEYVSHLVAWGDMYFIRNTWESLTSATMLYVWASNLLGGRPEAVKENERKEDKSFQQIEDYYADMEGGIPQFLIELEEQISQNDNQDVIFKVNDEVPYNDIRAYFGVPENERILAMWDLTEDRLFKIRNSLDINGNPRTTLLYEPAKDPLSVAEANAQGGAAVPGGLGGNVISYPYRFSYMISIAKSLVSLLMQLGADMEAALAKQDAEELLLLASTQEETILKMGISIHENQLAEAERDIEILEISKRQAEERRDYYKNNITQFISEKEQAALDMADVSAGFSSLSGVTSMAAGIAHLAPQVGSPFAMKYGGLEIGNSLKVVATGYKTMAGIYGHISQRMQTMAQYQRRKEEWELQKTQAEREIEQIEKQMEGAKLKKKSAQMDLEIQQKNYEFKQQSLAFLKSKFTGKELYQWLSGRMASTMWQTYQLALELGLGAQAAYRFETDCTQTFLKFDYWDAGHKGLWAGQGLMLSLNRMEEAYHRNNTRKLEIEKHISMANMLPEALEALKATGKCEFHLPEEMFAGDYPGGYLRKISSISLSIPVILPPYETIKAILRQNSSMILTEADKKGMDYLMHNQNEMPDSIKISMRYGEKIAISKGIDDTGLFVLDFRDERYLPFEGTGVHSFWSLEMPKESNHFNMGDMSDIIITVRYTSKEDDARGNGSFYQYVAENILGQSPSQSIGETC